jgi:glycerol uptake operon antiterminator
MNNILAEKMKKSPVIAGVKDLEKFDDALNSDCDIIFLLCGSIFNIKESVRKAKEKNKTIFIHVDLLDGFSKDVVALKYIFEEIKPDGIISTKNSQLKAAKTMGFMTVQRIFIIDSLSIDTAIKASQMINPDAIEIMPGIMPKITKKMSDELDVPVPTRP